MDRNTQKTVRKNPEWNYPHGVCGNGCTIVDHWDGAEFYKTARFRCKICNRMVCYNCMDYNGFRCCAIHTVHRRLFRKIKDGKSILPNWVINQKPPYTMKLPYKHTKEQLNKINKNIIKLNVASWDLMVLSREQTVTREQFERLLKFNQFNDEKKLIILKPKEPETSCSICYDTINKWITHKCRCIDHDYCYDCFPKINLCPFCRGNIDVISIH
jgi:hypothetical protein